MARDSTVKLLLAALATVACRPTAVSPFHGGGTAGVFVSYVHGCERGCEQIQRGDLILAVDDRPVRTTAAFDAIVLDDGRPHRLSMLVRGTLEPKRALITVSPHASSQELPPLFVVGASELDRAPAWARRRMFGHASPMVQLVAIDGGILDGRQLRGKKRLMVYWDWGDRIEQGYAVAFMQVLQKAQADLAAKDVEIMFVHVAFPTARKQPMNDTDLRGFAEKWSVTEDGRKLPGVPLYRRPNRTEYNAARELGLENAYTVMENLGQSPAIVVLDASGVVRWHSEGVALPPEDALVQKPDQYTIISAVQFALEL